MQTCLSPAPLQNLPQRRFIERNKGEAVLHIKVCLQVLEGTSAYVEKKVIYKAFCGSSGSCLKSDKLPQVIVSVGAED